MPTFVVLQGPDKGNTIKTVDDVVIIGRGSEQAPLTDQTVSRRHAELKSESGVWTLTDANSANGTYVNGVRTQKPVRLKHGDQIRMGSTLLVYTGDESVEQVAGSKIPRDMVTLDAGQHIAPGSLRSVPSSEDSVVMAAPDTAYAVKAWKAIRELTDVIGSLISSDQLLPRVMDILFEQVPTERGIIFVPDEMTGDLLPAVIRFANRRARAEATKTAISASRTVLNHVVEKREGVLVTNAGSDERFQSGKSVQDLGLRSIICAPILARDTILGVIHLDCPIQRHVYNEHELRLVTAIGYQTGLAMENARLMQAYVERERLAAAGETAAHLSHSIKNILQGMRAGGDLLKRGLDKRDFAETTKGWRILDRNLDKCYALMMNMLAFSKNREPQVEMMQVNKVVREVVDLCQGQADEAKIMLLADLDESVPPTPIDYDGLHQVLLNLISNAMDAVARGSGVVNVRTSFDPLERRVQISVLDNGPGVPEDMREKVFAPFYSTKGQGGTGLGLAVSLKIVQEMNGTIELLTPQDGGAEFVVSLPTADARRRSAGDTQGPRR